MGRDQRRAGIYRGGWSLPVFSLSSEEGRRDGQREEGGARLRETKLCGKESVEGREAREEGN